MTDFVPVSAPVGLGREGVSLWDSVASKYQLRPDDLTVLRSACKVADRIQMLEDVDRELGHPIVSKGSMGQPVIHPLVGEIKAQHATLASLLKQLKLPDSPAGAGVNQNRAAGRSRWAQAHGSTA